jgi:DNA-binding NarL/FixJ family response regulator
MLVDDHALLRTGVANIINQEADLHVVAEAGNGIEALEAYDRHRPDVTLLDLRMPVMDGREFARRYQALPVPHVPIVACVAALDVVHECADLNAASVLSKPFDLDELLQAVRTQLSPVR